METRPDRWRPGFCWAEEQATRLVVRGLSKGCSEHGGRQRAQNENENPRRRTRANHAMAEVRPCWKTKATHSGRRKKSVEDFTGENELRPFTASRRGLLGGPRTFRKPCDDSLGTSVTIAVLLEVPLQRLVGEENTGFSLYRSVS